MRRHGTGGGRRRGAARGEGLDGGTAGSGGDELRCRRIWRRGNREPRGGTMGEAPVLPEREMWREGEREIREEEGEREEGRALGELSPVRSEVDGRHSDLGSTGAA